ncbi:putative porin [Pasteurella langaaensis DSM 22999]|uniref:Putative porin n=1 Tax=Alitibacter langaaensis DSM 22999 TaxID=1122935 RepID=A0A2U0SPZ7_9PAST|nr:porin [Pasteurella langaaensis]PVX33418.1 putative porin [Pasteurella langaaensis DSM 22999]
MKKSLSLLTLSLLASATAHGVEIYKKDGLAFQINGQYRPMIVHSEGQRTDLRDRGSRIEFILKQDMGGWTLVGKNRIIFNGKDANGSNNSGFGEPRTAQLYLGLEQKSIGRLYFGRLPTNGDAIMLGDYQLGGNGRNPLTASTSKGIHYRSAAYAGFEVGADYLFGSAVKDLNSTSSLKNGYGLALYYTNKFNDDWRFRFRAGYTRDAYDSHQFKAPDNNGVNRSWIANDVNRDAWRVSTEVKYRDFEVAYNYGELKDLQFANYLDTDRVKEKRHFLAARYFFTPKFAAYSQFRYEKRGENVNRGYTAGLDYRPIKNFITFIEFARDRNIANVNVHNDYANSYYTGFRFLF